MNTPNISVACFGETLWDAAPDGLFVGGAPYNVAYHLARMGARALLISAVGRDDLGRLALKRAEDSGIDISCVQIAKVYPTGLAEVTLDDDGNASYDIRHPVAWDDIQQSRLLAEKLDECQALVYGTLASRFEVTRTTLMSLISGYKGLKVCDLNLRRSGDGLDQAMELAREADILKLNEEELFALADATKTGRSLESAMIHVYKTLGPSMLFVTRGSKASVFYDGIRSIFASPPGLGPVVDTIGAGDSFTAAITHGLLRDIPVEDCLDNAVRLGSFVTTRRGAQPSYDPSEVLEHHMNYSR